MVNPLDKVKPTIDREHASQREHVSMTTDPLKHRVVYPSSEIIGKGAAIFTDMTETMVPALDQQMAMSSDAQKPEGILGGHDVIVGQQIGDSQMEKTQGRTQVTSDPKETYPDLFLPVAENHRISDRFCGYLDSLSAQIITQWYWWNQKVYLIDMRTSIYAVDRVNGTMYGKFSVGYRIIHEKATVIPQFQQTPLEDEYNAMKPSYVSTLPGTTGMVTPIGKSMPVTQASQMPVLPIVPSE